MMFGTVRQWMISAKDRDEKRKRRKRGGKK